LLFLLDVSATTEMYPLSLHDALPIFVVALVHLDMVEHIAIEAQLRPRAHAGQIGGDVAAVVLEQQAVPLAQAVVVEVQAGVVTEDRKSTRLNSSHVKISYAVFCLKKK